MTADAIETTAESLFRVADLRAFLMGEWAIERSIVDRRTGQSGTFEGQGHFVAEDEVLVYREEGCLALGAFETIASQVYRYRFPTLQRAAVAFGDGRAFIELDLSGGSWAAEHRCAPDLYHGRFAALDADRWRAQWEITAPRKNQRLESLYTRVCARAERWPHPSTSSG
jgi:hypothetical protein